MAGASEQQAAHLKDCLIALISSLLQQSQCEFTKTEECFTLAAHLADKLLGDHFRAERCMRAVMTNPGTVPSIGLEEVARPTPAPNEALVRVLAFSLNAGETRTALEATTRYTPGWDFAGVVEEAAADGSSSAAGAKVFGFVAQGAWAEFVKVRSGMVVEFPLGFTVAQASALPVAGVTAMVCLEKAGPLLGRRVLITGAAGGVGRFACQLAALSGASVFAVSRRTTLKDQLLEDGIAPVAIFPTMVEARTAGAYDVIFDSVGGQTLSNALMALAPKGICINCGNSERSTTSFDALEFYRLVGGGRFQSVWLGTEPPEVCRAALMRLAQLVSENRLRVPVSAVMPWSEVDVAAARLVGQSVDGKIVLEIA
jgi:NADPH2:quinone reductase